MKIALLIPLVHIASGRTGFVWQTPEEVDLTCEFGTREEAMQNKPVEFILLDDGWNRI